MSRLKRKAPVAQLDERRASISQDVGSSPSGGAKFKEFSFDIFESAHYNNRRVDCRKNPKNNGRSSD